MIEHERRELEPPALLLSRGSLGPDVKRIQEWLCLHGFHTAIDGDFGPATERAAHAFQWDRQHDEAQYWTPGIVTRETWAALAEPLRSVLDWKRQHWPTRPIGDSIVDCARAHIAAQPREVGKPNGGPWVRYYCRGQEVPWCAGFATTVLGQALGHDEWYTLSCDELAGKARVRGAFRYAGENVRPSPGDLFLIRRLIPGGPRVFDWIHCGIVTAVGPDYFETIEGNTNTDGSREGTAVHARVRAVNARTDFVLIGEDGT